jgi:hypothetical protein
MTAKRIAVKGMTAESMAAKKYDNKDDVRSDDAFYRCN